jgi:hypothetical protein
MQDQLQRLIRLSRRTGDRIIAFDPENPDNAYALLPVDAYERLVDGAKDVALLTEDELIDKINCDVALWKSENEGVIGSLDFYNHLAGSEMDKEDKTAGITAGATHMTEEAGRGEVNRFFAVGKAEFKKEKKAGWSIPKERKEAAEEVEEKGNEEDEDRQYLEPIAF